MKGWYWLVLPLLLATGPGCMLLPKDWLQARGTRAEAEPPPPPRAVRPDEINESNWAGKVEEMRAEVDYAETQPVDPITVHPCDGVK